MTNRRLTCVMIWLVAVALVLGPTKTQADDEAKPKSAAASGSGRGEIVYVGPSLGWAIHDAGETRSPSLLRELARQALLIAARDESMLATRDSWLASQLPTSGENAPFELIANARASYGSLEVVRGFGGQQRVLLKLPFAVRKLDQDVPDFVVNMEEASRTSFVDMLKQAGFSSAAQVGQPTAALEPFETAERIEECLGELTEFSQFAALRAIHSVLRKSGETPALLGQLVRGYAQLGVLTELCWTPAHKVFKARALLYAQRLAHKYPGPGSLDHLAFAQALAGLPYAALDTLGKASAAVEKERQPAGDAAQLAPWHAALEAYCHIDTESLEKLSNDSEVAALACFLRYLALEQSGCETLAIEWGVKLANSTLPSCFRIYAGLNRLVGVGLGHAVTQAAPTDFAECMQKELSRFPGLPPSVKGSLGAAEDWKPKAKGSTKMWNAEAAVFTALLDCAKSPPASMPAGGSDAGAERAGNPAIDDNELRWETLGLLLREISFEQVWRRITFLQQKLGVSPDEYLKETRPLADAHPYGTFLQLYHWQPAGREKYVDAACANKPLGIELPGVYLGTYLQTIRQAKGLEFTVDAMRNCDDTSFELMQKVGWGDQNEDYARRLLAVSPHSPIAQEILVTRQFDEFRERAKEWEKTAGRHPRLALGLAKLYLDEDPDHAERLLRSAASISHEKQAYMELAAFYEKQDKEARWLATLEEYLKQPSFGLEHAQVQVQIADHFIAKGEWAEAKPYADGAAQSYSAWGLYKAAHVHEALREWSEAEKYYQAAAQRYRGENMSWYNFCKRTGYGREAHAREVAKILIAAGEAPDWRQATFFELEKQLAKAFDALERASVGNHPFYLMEIALLADHEKQTDRRDQALRKIGMVGMQIDKNAKGNSGVEIVGLAEAFIADLEQGGKATFDIAELEKRLLRDDSKSACNLHWFLGSYLDRCGKPEAAIEQWKQCLACPLIDYDVRTLAGAALIEHSVDDTQYDNPLLKKTKSNPGEP